MTVPTWQASMVNGSRVTDLFTNATYQVIHDNLTVTVEGPCGAIRER